MARSGYSEEFGADNNWTLIRYRGAVKSALRGKRGQSALREMAEALDAMPVKELSHGALQCENGMCALGALAAYRGTDVREVDPYCVEDVADTFGIAGAMAREIMFENDDDFGMRSRESKSWRWHRMRNWVSRNILDGRE